MQWGMETWQCNGIQITFYKRQNPWHVLDSLKVISFQRLSRLQGDSLSAGKFLGQRTVAWEKLQLLAIVNTFPKIMVTHNHLS